MLTAKNADWQLALSSLWPTVEELPLLEGSYYNLIKRGGFVNSPAYSSQPSKRHTIHMLAAGSCFKRKITGQIGDVSADGNHPVYRYGKPLYLGVKL